MIVDLLYIIIAAVIGLYLLIQLLNLYALIGFSKRQKAKSKKQNSAQAELPNVSVLLAARNEEDNILRCLEALNRLDYPKDKIQVLVGNDQSEDRTADIVSAFIADKPHFTLISLTGNEFSQTKGKARVLATLAHKAKGSVFLITDADIEVPATWARHLVSHINEHVAISAGTTWIEGHNSFEYFQAVDWMYFMGMVNSFASIGLPLTSVGNNMAVSARAYWSTGGYEAIKFSITEDYALYKEVRKKGYDTVNLMSSESLVFSKPIENFTKLMNQRKRWLVGGWDLPLHWKVFLFTFGAYYIASLVLLCLNFHLWLLVVLCKQAIQLVQIGLIYRTLRQKIKQPVHILFYDLYLYVIIPLVTVWFFMPAKTVWKGRKY